MQYFLFGILALAATLLAARQFTVANPTALARKLRIAAGVAAACGALAFTLRGATGYAVPLVMLALWLFSANSRQWPNIPGWGRPSQGQSSRVSTEYLEVELDHATGAVTGRVVKGVFNGRRIENLKPAELALLWQDCRFNEPQSAQIIEVYLDGRHATWREDMARGEAEMSRGPDGRMTRAEAADILGVRADSTEDEIRRAHRDLMLKLHPDRGGSNYLAAKINEAKDVLLTTN